MYLHTYIHVEYRVRHIRTYMGLATYVYVCVCVYIYIHRAGRRRTVPAGRPGYATECNICSSSVLIHGLAQQHCGDSFRFRRAAFYNGLIADSSTQAAASAFVHTLILSSKHNTHMPVGLPLHVDPGQSTLERAVCTAKPPVLHLLLSLRSYSCT